MVRLAMVLALVAACGGKGKPPPGPGSGSAIYAKKFAISWGIEPNGTAKQDVFLQTTDDTGKQTSYPLGTYDGVCTVGSPDAAVKAAMTVTCMAGATGIELDAVLQKDPLQDKVFVLKLKTQQGAAPDPMSGEEILRVNVTPGAALQVGA